VVNDCEGEKINDHLTTNLSKFRDGKDVALLLLSCWRLLATLRAPSVQKWSLYEDEEKFGESGQEVRK